MPSSTKDDLLGLIATKINTNAARQITLQKLRETLAPMAAARSTSVRIFTDWIDCVMTNYDDIVEIKKFVPDWTTVYLPSSPTLGKIYTVKDGRGDAERNNIVVKGSGGVTIDGSTIFAINIDRGFMSFYHNGTEWKTAFGRYQYPFHTMTAGYSCRRTNPSYDGPCLQLSDGTNHVDIGFTGSGELDGTAAALAQLAGKVGVRTWYDQSRNGYHLSAGVLAVGAMPTLNLTGTPSGKPCVSFGIVGIQAGNCRLTHAAPHPLMANIWAGGGYILAQYRFRTSGNGGFGSLYTIGNELYQYRSATTARFTVPFSTSGYVTNVPVIVTGNTDAAWQTLELEYNSDSTSNLTSVRLDGVSRGTLSIGATGTPVDNSGTTFTLGSSSSTGTMDGDVAAFYIFKDIPS